MIRALVAMLALTLLGGASVGGEVQTLEVRQAGPGYEVTFVATLDRPPDRVYAALTDYAHLSRLNPGIIESRVIHRGPGDRLEVRSVLRGCVLFFCRRLVRVEVVEELAGRRIRARIRPGPSDFRQGMARWAVSPGPGQGSRLRLEAEVVPDFWIPPLIGRWATEQSLRRNLSTLVDRLERGGRR